jgi:mannose-1-phosphate guanylyltransferase
LIFAVDHVINDVSEFHEAVCNAIYLADKGHLVTFGIVPHVPDTAYGYNQKGSALQNGRFKGEHFLKSRLSLRFSSMLIPVAISVIAGFFFEPVHI